MQPLTAEPRQALSDDAVFALLTTPSVEVSAGLELLDTANRVVADITDDLVGGDVTRDNYATVHGVCDLQITRELAWGKDRVRPYMVLSDGTTTARFNLGVYVLTTPDIQGGESPRTFDVTGYDLLHFLNTNGPGDTYVIEPAGGTNLVPNPSTEVDTTGWESNGAFGTYTPAAFGRSTTRASDGTASLQVTWPGAKSWVNQSIDGFQIGKTYRIAYDVWVPAGGPNMGLDIVFTKEFPAVATPKDQWVTLEFIWTATETQRFVGPTAPENTSSQQVWIDNFRVEALADTYVSAIRAVVNASGVGARLLIAGANITDTVIPGPMVWALTEQPTTWLRIINDLLDSIGYRGLYADPDGTLRSEPYQPPAERAPEWTFDITDETTNLVGEQRSMTADVWKAPNHWRFVRKGMNYQPVEGDGIYTVENEWAGPTSQAALGRVVRKLEFLEAADQAALVAQGDRIVNEDLQVVRSYSLEVEPLPILGHFDVAQYADPDLGRNDKVLVTSWQINLDGSPGRLDLEAV